MRVRPYQIITAIGILFVVVFLLFTKTEATDLYKPDNWATMSISIGASILTLVGIITAIVISGENEKRGETSESLAAILNKIEEKKRVTPDRRVREIYDESQKKLQATIDFMSPLRYVESLIGISSFFSLLISSLLAITGYSFVLVLFSFLVGVFLLVGYVGYIVEEFFKIDSFSFPKKGEGTLSLNNIEINGNAQHFDPPENKEIILEFNQNIERVAVNVRFEGKGRNYFLHATIKYRNGLVSYIPDSNTYLANFGFVNNIRLTLLEREFDTGILQTEGTMNLDFDIILRSQRGDPEENPLIARGFIDRLGETDIYKHCSITDAFIVDSIELRIYEDRFFKPNYKRREIDCLTLTINRT